jgi:outer membrane lipoprotein-sorting protein
MTAYFPPSPIEIIADEQSVVVRDRKLATQDLYPLSQTPLLLSDRIDLLRETNVVAVRCSDRCWPSGLSVIMALHTLPSRGSMMLPPS